MDTFIDRTFFGYMHLSNLADIAVQVLDRCAVSNPRTLDPNSKDFEFVFDYSFVEDHSDEHTR